MHGVAYRRSDLCTALPRLGLCLVGSLRHGLAQASTPMAVTHTVLTVRSVLPFPIPVAISVAISVAVAIPIPVAAAQ